MFMCVIKFKYVCNGAVIRPVVLIKKKSGLGSLLFKKKRERKKLVTILAHKTIKPKCEFMNNPVYLGWKKAVLTGFFKNLFYNHYQT